MKPIKEEIEIIMAKYLENLATEDENVALMDALADSAKLRTQLDVMAAALNGMSEN